MNGCNNVLITLHLLNHTFFLRFKSQEKRIYESPSHSVDPYDIIIYFTVIINGEKAIKFTQNSTLIPLKITTKAYSLTMTLQIVTP